MALATSFTLQSIEQLIDEASAVPLDPQRRLLRGRRLIGRDLFFSKFDSGIVVDVFLAVVYSFPQYAQKNRNINAWSARGCPHLLHLIVQSFMTALIPLMPNRGKKKRKEDDSEKPKEPTKESSSMKVTDEQRVAILKAVIPLCFPVECKFWGLCSHALCLKDNPALLMYLVREAMSRGEASFVAIEYCIREPWLSALFEDPSVIINAAMVGPLRALSVEAFACGRSKEFRQRCREVVLELHHYAEKRSEWMKAAGRYRNLKVESENSRFVEPLQFSFFNEAVMEMLKELQGAPPADDKIDIGWAHVAIKKSACKYYNEKIWRAENLQEVIWTVLAQRPFMKKYVVEMLSNKFNDPVEAEKWKAFHVPAHLRTKIKFNDTLHIDPRSLNPPFLSIPECVESVEFVRHAHHLKRVENLLEDCVLGDFPVAGLDAEWSSYVSHSKATVLQLALRTKIFIIDIDAIPNAVLAAFFEKFFTNPNILKIGYRFSEDLIQLRSAVPGCPALYHPANLICIDRLVRSLMEESVKRPDVSLEGIVHPLVFNDSENAEEGDGNRAENEANVDVNADGADAGETIKNSAESIGGGNGTAPKQAEVHKKAKEARTSPENAKNLKTPISEEKKPPEEVLETAAMECADGSSASGPSRSHDKLEPPNPFGRVGDNRFGRALANGIAPPLGSLSNNSGTQSYTNPFGFPSETQGTAVVEETSKNEQSAPALKSDGENGQAEENNNVDTRKESNEEENGLLAPIKGLSALCERILGSPLDKSEQCSVWDRRPLRDLQLRYAALDAYTMIMIYEKCVEWGARLGVDVGELCARQDAIVVSLPLFCGD